VRTRDRLQCCHLCLLRDEALQASEGQVADLAGRQQGSVVESAQQVPILPVTEREPPPSPYLDLDGSSGPAKGCYLSLCLARRHS